MKPNQKLAKQLENDVYELCQPCGRRVGTEGHQIAERWVEQRLSEIEFSRVNELLCEGREI